MQVPAAAGHGLQQCQEHCGRYHFHLNTPLTHHKGSPAWMLDRHDPHPQDDIIRVSPGCRAAPRAHQKKAAAQASTTPPRKCSCLILSAPRFHHQPNRLAVAVGAGPLLWWQGPSVQGGSGIRQKEQHHHGHCHPEQLGRLWPGWPRLQGHPRHQGGGDQVPNRANACSGLWQAVSVHVAAAHVVDCWGLFGCVCVLVGQQFDPAHTGTRPDGTAQQSMAQASTAEHSSSGLTTKFYLHRNCITGQRTCDLTASPLWVVVPAVAVQSVATASSAAHWPHVARHTSADLVRRVLQAGLVLRQRRPPGVGPGRDVRRAEGDG